MLTDFFNGKALNKRLNPDEAVAEGATILAGILSENDEDLNRNIRLRDVTPHSLGIRTLDH